MTSPGGGVAGAADVRGFAIGSGVGPPEACGTLRINVSVETWRTASRHTLFLGCEWRETAA